MKARLISGIEIEREDGDDDEGAPDVVRQRLHRPAEHHQVGGAGGDDGRVERLHDPTVVSSASAVASRPLRRPKRPVCAAGAGRE